MANSSYTDISLIQVIGWQYTVEQGIAGLQGNHAGRLSDKMSGELGYYRNVMTGLILF